MNDDHPLKHPENARGFLTYVGGMGMGAMGVVWLARGARATEFPGFVIVVLFVVAMFAWTPIFRLIVGRLPAQTWAEVPKGKRWSELLFTGAFVISFVLWSAVLLAFTWPLLREVEQ